MLSPESSVKYNHQQTNNGDESNLLKYGTEEATANTNTSITTKSKTSNMTEIRNASSDLGLSQTHFQNKTMDESSRSLSTGIVASSNDGSNTTTNSLVNCKFLIALCLVNRMIC